MGTKEKARIHGDRSPEISPEERRRHDLEAEKVNYRIALDELSLYINRSSYAPSGRDAARERTWIDHQGRAWVTESPISPSARNELRMILKVVGDYEGKRSENSRNEQVLNEIGNLRAAGREQSPNRLAYFERQTAQPEPTKAIAEINGERIPEHGIEMER